MALETTLGSLAEAIGARLRGDAQTPILRVATLSGAGPDALSFLANRRYKAQLRATRAAAVVLSEEFLGDCPGQALVMDNPYLGFARAAALLNPPPRVPPGVHPSAVVDAGARVHALAAVGACAVIGAGAEVAARAVVGPGCVLGEAAVVGEDSRLVANVTLGRGVVLGRRVLLHPGVVVGADGFGIANDNGVWEKVPQLGSVRIGDDVEVGANTTIDRGALEDTVVEEGVKLDNLIQVGHNVRIGAHTAIAACVAIGGSARIGRRCTIGGAASLAGHLEIADDVHLTATSAVPNSIAEPGVYSSGMPVQENRAWRRSVIRLRQLDEFARILKSLQVRVAKLEGGDG
jgi:UDP-3-O-[3-hydroxymyristoyl] glucosamine N-acyltransferase